MKEYMQNLSLISFINMLFPKKNVLKPFIGLNY